MINYLTTSQLIKRLYDDAEKHAEDRRLAEFGPGGGNPNATVSQEIELIAAKRIETLLKTIRVIREDRDN